MLVKCPNCIQKNKMRHRDTSSVCVELQDGSFIYKPTRRTIWNSWPLPSSYARGFTPLTASGGLEECFAFHSSLRPFTTRTFALVNFARGPHWQVQLSCTARALRLLKPPCIYSYMGLWCFCFSLDKTISQIHLWSSLALFFLIIYLFNRFIVSFLGGEEGTFCTTWKRKKTRVQS